MTVTLRPYQIRAINELRVAIRAGKRRMVLVSPTGSGKTIMACEIIRSAVANGRRVIVIAHRKELIDQTVDKLARFGVTAGVVMGDDNRADSSQPVQICTIQTLARRLDRLPPADIIIYDECHHIAANTSREVLDRYPAAVVVGLTATPWRTDKLGLADIFEGHALAATPRQLMNEGALVECAQFAYDAPDLHGVGTVAGDFNQGELGIACNTAVLVGSIVKEWQTHAAGRRTICFASSIDHSKSITAQFCVAGIKAAHLDCHTPKDEREQILADLASGAVTVVSSVGILVEGFDCPACEVAIDARPTKSFGLCRQMYGRVLRPSPETGKVKALIHDHAGNAMRHGFVDSEVDYSLEATPKRVREMHTCPFCRFLFGSLKPDGTCPSCAELIASPIEREINEETSERSGKIIVDGKRIDRATIEKMRAERVRAGIKRALSDEDVVRAARATTDEKRAEYKRLVELCKILKKADGTPYMPGWAANQYRNTFGKWPRFNDHELVNVAAATCPFLQLPERSHVNG